MSIIDDYAYRHGQQWGIELDQKIRAILERATPDTVLADTRALMALGFPAWSSFNLLEKTIITRHKSLPALVSFVLKRPVVRNTLLHDWRNRYPLFEDGYWHDEKDNSTIDWRDDQ